MLTMLIALVILFMSIKFIIGAAKNLELLARPKIELSLAIVAAILSVGSIIAPFVTAIPPTHRLLLDSPIFILVAGLIVLRTLGLKL